MEPEPLVKRVIPVEGALAYPLADTELDEAGDVSTAFADFYRDNRDRLVRALALTLGNVDLGSDAVDEAMTRAFQRWDRVGGFDDPGGWVYRVGLNWATSAIRRRNRSPRPVAAAEHVEPHTVREPDLAAALLELPVHQRAVVVCRFYLGLSEAETAAALSIRAGTAKSRLHRALQYLETRVAHLRPKEQS